MAKIDVKVVMLGKEFSGKTSVVERFLNERFAGENRYQATIGAAYGARWVSNTQLLTLHNISSFVVTSFLQEGLCRWKGDHSGSVGHSGQWEIREYDADVLQETVISLSLSLSLYFIGKWADPLGHAISRQWYNIHVQGGQGCCGLLRCQWSGVLGPTGVLGDGAQEAGGGLQNLHLCHQNRFVTRKQQEESRGLSYDYRLLWRDWSKVVWDIQQRWHECSGGVWNYCTRLPQWLERERQSCLQRNQIGRGKQKEILLF